MVPSGRYGRAAHPTSARSNTAAVTTIGASWSPPQAIFAGQDVNIAKIGTSNIYNNSSGIAAIAAHGLIRVVFGALQMNPVYIQDRTLFTVAIEDGTASPDTPTPNPHPTVYPVPTDTPAPTVPGEPTTTAVPATATVAGDTPTPTIPAGTGTVTPGSGTPTGTADIGTPTGTPGIGTHHRRRHAHRNRHQYAYVVFRPRRDGSHRPV